MIKFLHGITSGAANDAGAQKRQALEHLYTIKTHILLTNRISGVEPSWSLPRLPEIHQLGFKQRGWSSHEISCHIQEVDATS
jgi:hypothetical protein